MSNRRPGWGGATVLLLMLIVVLTGIWYLWNYVWSAELGNLSSRNLVNAVVWGGFSMNLHRWAAYATLVSIGMWSLQRWRRGQLRAFLGVALPVVVLLGIITGSSLPWHQALLWSIQKSLPTPPRINTSEVLWWYGLHVVILPLILAGLSLAALRATRPTPVQQSER